MPTIDQLDVAAASGDTDSLPVSQGGIVRRVSRSQLLASTQPTLAVASGQLLGRISVGTGSPEAITVGANLSLSQGRLDATVSPFSIAAQPLGQPPSIADLIPIAQGGANQALPFGQFMAGLSNLAGLDISMLAVTPPGVSAPRSLSSVMGDITAIESFGAKGDGTTDDTASFAAAGASQLPIRLGPRTYLVSGPLVVSASATWIGTQGQTTVRGSNATNWITVSASTFRADGVIFDGAQSTGVVISTTCSKIDLHRCEFNNATIGLTIQANTNNHTLRDCGFNSNSLHGLWIQSGGPAVLIESCRARGNGGAGLKLTGTSAAVIVQNICQDNASMGIDIGGSSTCEVSRNIVMNSSVGLNCGGGSSNRVDANRITNCGLWAIQANNVEAGLSCNQLAITNNWISLASAVAGGILLNDGPQNVLISGNQFVGSSGATINNCLWANTDTVTIDNNRWNFSPRYVAVPTLVGGLQTLQVPDIADIIMVTSAPSGIASIVTTYQAQVMGQLSFIKVQSGGSGYSFANVSIGGIGSGASARAILANGTVIGIVITAPGTGFGSIGSSLPVTISGDGIGATTIGYAGPPVPEERRILLRCNTATRFLRTGSIPFQDNWTGTDLTVAPGGDVEWRGTLGNWRASRFASGDYLAPDGTGGTSLRSLSGGDVQLHPSGNGHLRFTSDTETIGCQTAIGRGAPEGLVTAPPGSVWHNLNGGTGTTLYVKRTGVGPTGWFALG